MGMEEDMGRFRTSIHVDAPVRAPLKAETVKLFSYEMNHCFIVVPEVIETPYVCLVGPINNWNRDKEGL
jgi:hypothetical protein